MNILPRCRRFLQKACCTGGVAHGAAIRSMGSKAFSAPPPIELEAIGETTSSVLFLHGLGDSGAGFLDLAQFLQKSMPHTRFVLPHAYVWCRDW